MDAGQDLDERRLARSVLTDERMDLSGAKLEIDLAQRLHAAEAARDAAKLDERRGGWRAHLGYAALKPPSTLKTFPVDFAERSEARKPIASATSSGYTLTSSVVRPR